MIIQTSSTEKGYADVAFTVPKPDFAKTLQIVKEINEGDRSQGGQRQ